MVAVTVLFPEDADGRVVLFPVAPRLGEAFEAEGCRWRVSDVVFREARLGHARLFVVFEPWDDVPF